MFAHNVINKKMKSKSQQRREEVQSQSPVPATAPVAGQTSMKFPQAIERLISGAKIRREEWLNREEYGLLKDNFLMIHRNGAFHTWVVSEGDMLAIDWIVNK